VALAEHRDWACRDFAFGCGFGQDLDFSTRDNVEGITRVSGPEQNVTGLELQFLNTRQDLLDLLGRQMTHQVARRQKLDPFPRIRLFACQRIFAKLGDVANGGSLLLQGQRRRVVNDRAYRKPRADKHPGRACIEALLMERQRPFIRKLNRQRGNQGAGGKSQQARKGTF
jgi:hypothetical protein